ncbi:Myb-like DNA-binding protein myb-1 [Tolypocladium ophioglossoides CBS 100239]|uniref:Myb-like DNA-binding protein myb-1 n=1 Tax=Tolypocladium ophioglossoides (strain CBS 100239) TaxID=1163406 RepID=A0A0L0N6J0_TOLOC|nr:Myb-like DNA-binding protein myb-1 [Tolypocladium ophioglossoides CBS 100239]
MSSKRKGPWSKAEDSRLMQLVQGCESPNWVGISRMLRSRSPKQCRERYHQNLKPTLNHEPITPEEGVEIERLVEQIGKRWAEIARRLEGRSDNAVKNWWNGNQNRRKRLENQRIVLPPRPETGEVVGHHPSHPRTHPRSWAGGPLPSPCLSDTGSNYTTSTAGNSRPLDQRISLPSLRSWYDPSNLGDQPLPSSLSSQASPALSPAWPISSPPQLLTAPSSPMQGQGQGQGQGREHQQQQQGQGKPDVSTRNGDSRMDMRRLLG